MRTWSSDLASGFLVFLIALPLCLGISLASGFPATAGIFTAIAGGFIATWISNSQLTIKGPAAGLIVIVLGCVTDFGLDSRGYRATLAVGVVAGLLQAALGLLKLGIIGELFPLTVVHALLSAIGVIIISKQFPTLVGVSAKGDPLALLARIPEFITQMNPEIALIGFLSLVILVVVASSKWKLFRFLPGQLLVLFVAVPLGIFLDLSHSHTYTFLDHTYQTGEKFLVALPTHLFDAVTLPDFSALQNPIAWKWIAMFTIIGSLESILSAKAVDLLDPLRRKTDCNRDLLAIGVANAAVALIGGLPMISEIVRSRANIDNGAKTRLANFFHGIFLLAAIWLFPGVLHRIPLAALAAMLIFTGYRLASPKVFRHTYHISKGQLIVFVGTIVGILATDLLIGALFGVLLEMIYQAWHGAWPTSSFRTRLTIESIESTPKLRPIGCATFSNWLKIRRHVENAYGDGGTRLVVIDFSTTAFIDHTVREKLSELSRELQTLGKTLRVEGTDAHQSVSTHPTSPLVLHKTTF